MRKLRYLIAASIDGFIARHDHSFDFLLMEGPHAQDFFETLGEFDAVLMGRATYDIAASAGEPNPYPAFKTFVVSKTLQEPPHPNVTVLCEGLEEAVTELKSSAGKDIWLCGGGNLAGQLLSSGLIDEVAVKINPVALGGGRPLFGDLGGAITLMLRDTKAYNNGVLLANYDVLAQTSLKAA